MDLQMKLDLTEAVVLRNLPEFMVCSQRLSSGMFFCVKSRTQGRTTITTFNLIKLIINNRKITVVLYFVR